MASDISDISGGPSSLARTHFVRYREKNRLRVHIQNTKTTIGDVLAPTYRTPLKTKRERIIKARGFILINKRKATGTDDLLRTVEKVLGLS